MSARFIEVHYVSGAGRPTLLNVERIEQVVEHDEGCIVFFVGEGPEGNILLSESIADMRRLLMGETSASRVKAHPQAIGWELHPELQP